MPGRVARWNFSWSAESLGRGLEELPETGVSKRDLPPTPALSFTQSVPPILPADLRVSNLADGKSETITQFVTPRIATSTIPEKSDQRDATSQHAHQRHVDNMSMTRVHSRPLAEDSDAAATRPAGPCLRRRTVRSQGQCMMCMTGSDRRNTQQLVQLLRLALRTRQHRRGTHQQLELYGAPAAAVFKNRHRHWP